MARNNGTRKSVIKADFDRQAIWRIAEQAEQDRSPTQEELAAEFGSDPDMVACAKAFPASIEDIVLGICEGDGRFLEQGRKLLKQHLKHNAKAVQDAARKPRGRPVRRPDMVSAPASSGDNGTLPVPVAGAIVQQRPATPADTPLFDSTDYADADLYGG